LLHSVPIAGAADETIFEIGLQAVKMMMARAATKHSAVPSHNECSEITDVSSMDLEDCAAQYGRGFNAQISQLPRSSWGTRLKRLSKMPS
jgi:hypothetical protein